MSLCRRVLLQEALQLNRKGLSTSRRFISTPPAYPGHIPLNAFEKTVLFAGAGLMSLLDPKRGDMVAACGETSASVILPRLRDHMLDSPEGRRILKERPRINTRTVDMNRLTNLPENTFGRTYITWLERTGVTPDTRSPVHYVDDPELAYVMQRYRECHDLYHCVVNLPVNVESELAVKYFEFANLGLPMAGFASLFGPLRLLKSKNGMAKQQRLFSEYVPWALKCGSSAKSLITVYWEERWEQDIGEMKRELGLWDAPPARWGKPLKEAQLAVQKQNQSTSV